MATKKSLDDNPRYRDALQKAQRLAAENQRLEARVKDLEAMAVRYAREADEANTAMRDAEAFLAAANQRIEELEGEKLIDQERIRILRVLAVSV